MRIIEGWRRRRRDSDGDRGSTSVMTVILIPVFILAVGLVVDGGKKLQADDNAQAISAQAARAAGSCVNATTGALPTVDLGCANTQANAVFAAAGATGSLNVVGQDLTASASITKATLFLPIVGIDTVTGTGTSTVQLTRTPASP